MSLGTCQSCFSVMWTWLCLRSICLSLLLLSILVREMLDLNIQIWESLGTIVQEIERIPDISAPFWAIMRKFHQINSCCFSEIRAVERVLFLLYPLLSWSIVGNHPFFMSFEANASKRNFIFLVVYLLFLLVILIISSLVPLKDDILPFSYLIKAILQEYQNMLSLLEGASFHAS